MNFGSPLPLFCEHVGDPEVPPDIVEEGEDVGVPVKIQVVFHHQVPQASCILRSLCEILRQQGPRVREDPGEHGQEFDKVAR
jgi:hypothetical protein